MDSVDLDIPEGMTPEDLARVLEEMQANDDPQEDKAYWLSLAKSAYQSSTDYLNANIRQQWEDSISHQNNEHAPGSKYHTEAYRARSRTFMPKTRSNNQSAEAVFAKAMFSTTDLVNLEPENENDETQAASADVMSYLMQHRLTKSIKWFMTAMGAYQDARVYGVCCSYQYWDFEEVIEDEPELYQGSGTGSLDGRQWDEPDLEAGNPATNEFQRFHESRQNIAGQDNYDPPVLEDSLADHAPAPAASSRESRVLRDKPACDLMPPENIRFEPNADWRDPINTSPYVIRLVPMYAGEARDKIAANGWEEHTIAELINAGTEINESSDVTRSQRQGENRQDPADQSGIEHNEFQLIWLHENFVRVGGQDYVYWTCGTTLLLSYPVPIEEAYPHLRYGERPMTLGVVVIESHRNYPNSPTRLFAPLQEQSNDIRNQRFDNVRLVLNKRYIVKRNQGAGGIDLAALGRSVPGGSVMTSNPESDIKVLETNDVTSSSYQEQDRLDLAMDELSGTFSQQTVQNNRNLNETVGGMEMMNAGASDVSEYAIRVFIETWVEPTLSQLVRLEQYYETDETLLALAKDKSQAFQRFGRDMSLDELLRQELTINVNAGFGKTDPQKRLNSFNIALSSVQALPTALARLEEDEVIKEIFGNAGFRDGTRFFKPLAEFEEEQKGRQPPIDPVKQKELELKDRDQQLRHQMEQQKAALERERWQAELALKREIEIMRLALEENKTMAQLQAQLGIKEREDKTKRDMAASQQTLDQVRLIQENENLKQGHDTYG